jgi:hypothetical protein
MHKKRLLLTLAVLLAVIAFAGTACCPTCSSLSSQRQQQNEPIVSGVDFGDVVMAKGIGENNKPISITNTFGVSEDVIYVVAYCKRIDSGTSLYARWSYEGEPFEDTPTITADRSYTDTYVEFHIEPTDFGVLKKGDYTVKIYVNGNPVKTVAFKLQ